MRKTLNAFAVALSVAGTACLVPGVLPHKANEEWLVVEGKTSVAIGQPAILTAVAKGSNRYEWVSLDGPHLVVDSSGSSAIISYGRAGTYRIATAASGSKKLGLAITTLTIGGQPQPGPSPVPPPRPPGPQPPGPGGELARWVSAQWRKVPGVTTEQVASIHRNFRDEEALLNASAGVQNEYSGLSGAELQRAASLKLVKLNRQSLGDAAEGWRVGFFAPLNDLLKQRQMSTATDLATAWGEIARGLEE